MSASAEVSGARPALGGGSRDVRPYFWLVSAAWLALLAWGVATQGHELATEWPRLLPWIILLAFVNLLPLDGWHSAHMVPDIPIAGAAAILLDPLAAAILGFVSAFDIREFQGKITATKTLFNRSQTALTYGAGSLLVHRLAYRPTTASGLIPLVLVSLATTCACNYLLVGLGIALEQGYPLSLVLRHMRFGTILDFGLTFVTWAILATMLTALYDDVHAWILLLFLAPTLLGRHALMRSQMLVETRSAYESRGTAIEQMEHRIHEERSDERRLIAAGLHDEVLQPLFKVTLMAQVLKSDLATGRLLEMDQDIPDLLNAAELAATSLRQLIGDLRSSPLGRGGLPLALHTMVTELRKQTTTKIDLETHLARPNIPHELAIYQIAKEALTNALLHARANLIEVSVEEEEQNLVLNITDDGVGFDPMSGRTNHFGLEIMRERAGSIGGSIFVDSLPGNGCRVTLWVPREPA
jgi:signal transduction histidine kinase